MSFKQSTFQFNERSFKITLTVPLDKKNLSLPVYTIHLNLLHKAKLKRKEANFTNFAAHFHSSLIYL